MMDAVTIEFVQRLGRLTYKWGLDECMGNIWGILLVSGDAMTQEDLRKASGYGSAQVSVALSRLEELGFIVTSGRKGRKRLYLAMCSFVDALENFFKRFVDNEVNPIIVNLSRRLQEISDPKYKANMERLVGEFEKGKLFMTYLLSTMKKNKDLQLRELQQVLQPFLV